MKTGNILLALAKQKEITGTPLLAARTPTYEVEPCLEAVTKAEIWSDRYTEHLYTIRLIYPSGKRYYCMARKDWVNLICAQRGAYTRVDPGTRPYKCSIPVQNCDGKDAPIEPWFNPMAVLDRSVKELYEQMVNDPQAKERIEYARRLLIASKGQCTAVSHIEGHKLEHPWTELYQDLLEVPEDLEDFPWAIDPYTDDILLYLASYICVHQTHQPTEYELDLGHKITNPAMVQADLYIRKTYGDLL
jgi:hypothetical protein